MSATHISDLFGSNVLASVPIWTSEGQVEMPLQQIEIDAAPKTTPFERAFNPYDFNGGCATCLDFFAYLSYTIHASYISSIMYWLIQ